MRRLYHPYWDWEDWKAGMWRSIGKQERKQMLLTAIEFTGNAQGYGAFMQRVIVEWPKACEHNLTERSMNRLAWVGHAAACMAIGSPEDVTREAWGHLTYEQRQEADAEAQHAVSKWEAMHAGEDRQIPFFMEDEGVQGRHTGRGRPETRGTVQSTKLSGNLPSNTFK